MKSLSLKGGTGWCGVPETAVDRPTTEGGGRRGERLLVAAGGRGRTPFCDRRLRVGGGNTGNDAPGESFLSRAARSSLDRGTSRQAPEGGGWRGDLRQRGLRKVRERRRRDCGEGRHRNRRRERGQRRRRCRRRGRRSFCRRRRRGRGRWVVAGRRGNRGRGGPRPRAGGVGGGPPPG